MSVDTSAPRSRRAVLAAALGGLGAVIASRLATPDAASAANGDPISVGGSFGGTTATTVTNTTAGGSAVALAGVAADGAGVWGTSASAVASNFAGGTRTGVVGISGPATDIALSTDETGVYGFSEISGNAAGVWGDTVDGTGVIGSGFWGVYGNGAVGVIGDVFSGGTGVYGFVGNGGIPDPTPDVGVEARAESSTSTALNVVGKARFSRSGLTRVLRNGSSKKIILPGVTTSSYILATLQTRRTGVYVHAVVPAAGSFTIYLNKAVTATTYIGYLVIN